MNVKLLILAILIALSFLSFKVNAQGTYTDNATVAVTVLQAAIVDIEPNLFKFHGYPGFIATPNDTSINRDTKSDQSTSYYFEIKNLGSVELQSIRANVSLPTANPWGTANAHQIGDFVLISNISTAGNTNFKYVAQRLWNTTPPLYIVPPNGCELPTSWDPTKCQFYIVRTAETQVDNEGEEWYMIIRAWTDGLGNYSYTNGSIYFASSPRTKTQTGTTDFSGISQPPQLTEVTKDGVKYGFAKISHTNSFIDGHVIRVDMDGDEAYFYYWNTELDKYPTLPTYGNLITSSLAPSQSIQCRLQVRIPFGVRAGYIEGQLTIIATATVTG